MTKPDRRQVSSLPPKVAPSILNSRSRAGAHVSAAVYCCVHWPAPEAAKGTASPVARTRILRIYSPSSFYESGTGVALRDVELPTMWKEQLQDKAQV
eukprot:5102078-Pleurochrysis_carterae.AAC.2